MPFLSWHHISSRHISVVEPSVTSLAGVLVALESSFLDKVSGLDNSAIVLAQLDHLLHWFDYHNHLNFLHLPANHAGNHQLDGPRLGLQRNIGAQD